MAEVQEGQSNHVSTAQTFGGTLPTGTPFAKVNHTDGPQVQARGMCSAPSEERAAKLVQKAHMQGRRTLTHGVLMGAHGGTHTIGHSTAFTLGVLSTDFKLRKVRRIVQILKC